MSSLLNLRIMNITYIKALRHIVLCISIFISNTCIVLFRYTFSWLLPSLIEILKKALCTPLSNSVLYLKHMIIVSCQSLIADRVQATIMSCKHDNHFSTDTLFIAFIIARHCLICNSSISERTSIASDNSSDFSSFFP